MTLPGLVYSMSLVERVLGWKKFVGLYLLNCVASAATTTFWHRKMGFVQS